MYHNEKINLMSLNKTKSNGFTLVELAIVIVIIGLITGGVLGASSLINSSKRNKVLSESSGFNTSIKAFYLEYNALPGDMRDADSYWPAVTSNGNNNRRIDYTADFMNTSEEHLAWQHLSLAEILPQSYTGTGGDIDSIPESEIDGYYRIGYQNDVYNISTTMISLNRVDTSLDTGKPNGPAISLKNLVAIDKKADDGKASRGKILGFNEEGNATCTDNDIDDDSADYLSPSNTDVTCKAFFIMDM